LRPALKALAQAPAGGTAVSNVRVNQLDALESEMPERPKLPSPGASTDSVQASAAEMQLEDARKLTRDNPAAVANIIKTWMNGEAPA
jgi:flagellar M-ring protein FliF